MQKFIIKKADSNQTAVKYLQRLLKDAPQGLIYKQIRKKNITLNDKKITGSEKLKEGDVLSVFMSDETIQKFMGESSKNTIEYERAFEKFKNPEIIYEDEHIIIMNKPVGILSQKSVPSDLTVNEWLIGYLLKTGVVTPLSLSNFTPSVCNRLDRNTGGLILFGKTLFGTTILNNLIKERNISKYYKTIVLGHIDKESTVSGYLIKDEKNNKVTVRSDSFDAASLIKTGYKPLRYNEKLDITELEVELITGKTHQIRAHLASLGHPIIGDDKYGAKEKNQYFKVTYGLKNQLLYAYRLEFPVILDYPEISGKSFSFSFDTIFDKYMRG